MNTTQSPAQLARFKQPHYDIFCGIPFRPQGALGSAPSAWAATHRLEGVPDPDNLPTEPLDRAAVRKICRDEKTPVLFGYVCAMAWGSQEKGPGGATRATKPWDHRIQIETNLNSLRSENLTRCAAYNLLSRQPGKVKGIGPSYLTKLLYFFSPADNFWIMDQWTSKSVNLLTGEQVVQLAETPTDKNKGGNYQAYCEEVDALAELLGVHGDTIEQRLMSKGEPDAWPWRLHLETHCEYNKERMRQRYPHIPPREL